MLIKENYAKYLYLVLTLFVVFIIYIGSVFRGWIPFDENFIFDELLFPIPTSFGEIPEIIKAFALNSHLESANTFFSNHVTVRSAPLPWFFIILFSFFFKANPIPYHFIPLFIHLINTALVWLILKNISNYLTNNKSYFSITIFTLIWALHSANTEAVMLATNWNAIFALTFCLFIIYLTTKDILNNTVNQLTFKKSILFVVLYVISLAFVEQFYTFPLIVFFLVCHSFKSRNNMFNSLKYSLPIFAGLFIYIIIYIISQEWGFKNLSTENESFTALLERNLWLSPQLFVHLLKLIIFPKTLSITQTNLVPLAQTLIEPYSIFCTLFYLFFLLAPITLFFVFKKRSYSFIFLLIYAFFFSVLPFLHILMPTYCLSADRYCYFPSFLFLLIIFHIYCILTLKNNLLLSKILFTILSLFLIFLAIRTEIRVLEWRYPEKLYKSAVNSETNPLYKGHRLSMYASYIGSIGKNKEAKEALDESINQYQKAITQFALLNKKIQSCPITLKSYGLDHASLISKAAYGIALIKNDFFHEPPKQILSFYEPFIRGRLNLDSVNQIAFYGGLLLNANRKEEAKEVLELGQKRFPYNSESAYYLIDYYLEIGDLENAYKEIALTYSYFPNQKIIYYKLLKYYEITGDLENQAKFAYLLGLRNHLPAGYLKAAQNYLKLNNLANAKKSIDKLKGLVGEDLNTLLLSSTYFEKTGDKNKAFSLLVKAYELSNSNSDNTEFTKVILFNLINTSIQLGMIDSVKLYESKLAELKGLAKK